MDTPLAIVGMGCLFPRSPGIKELWRTIRTGADAIGDVPSSHWDPADYFDADPTRPDMTYCRRGGFLSAYPFDPMEFGIPPTAHALPHDAREGRNSAGNPKLPLRCHSE